MRKSWVSWSVGQRFLLAVLVSVGMLGCQSLSRTEKGAAAGAGAGAVVGGAVGKATGAGTAEGAILGAAIGGAAGAVIGRQMDKRAEELRAELENAEVERVGEGIKVTFPSGLLFDFDSARLRPAVEEDLREFARSVRDFEGTQVLIVGHTDTIGSEAYNENLSERRAAAVEEFLYRHGVLGENVMAVGKGETEPVATNETEAGRQQNRRVEIALYASERYREAIKAREESS